MTSSAIRTFTSLDNGALDTRTGGCKAGNPQVPPATGYTLHLPLPPSVNNFDRTKYGRPLGNSSPKVESWKRHADVCTIMQPRPKPVLGDFTINIVWDRSAKPIGAKAKFDVDNRIKCLLDWLQSRELIENDGYCEDLHARWGPTEKGCIITVREAVFLCAE